VIETLDKATAAAVVEVAVEVVVDTAAAAVTVGEGVMDAVEEEATAETREATNAAEAVIEETAAVIAQRAAGTIEQEVILARGINLKETVDGLREADIKGTVTIATQVEEEAEEVTAPEITLKILAVGSPRLC